MVQDCPRAEDGTLFHIEGRCECWVDTVYMVVPSLVLADRFDDAVRQFEGHQQRLFDVEAGHYGWRWDEEIHQLTHPGHWGTGNG